MITIIRPEAVNPELRDSTRRSRLFKAVEGSYRALGWARSLHDRLVTSYAGPLYGHQDDMRRNHKYVNKAAQFINAYTMLLAGNVPEVSIESDYRELIPFAKSWQVNLNMHLKSINIEQQLQDCIQNALFLMGIMKCHYADSGFVVFEQEIEADPGQCYASSLSPHDYVFDMSVKKRGSARFAGDGYRMAISKLHKGLEMGIYTSEAAEVRATSKMSGVTRTSESLSAGILTDEDELEPMFDACDIYDYDDRVFRTYAVSDRNKMILRGKELAEYEWDGLETGPYEMFRFWTVPDNVIPKSPLGDLEAMDRFINNMAIKTAKQANSQKDVLAYVPGGEETANAIALAGDRQSIKINSMDDAQFIRQPGVDASVSATMGNFLNLFDEAAGNLRSILGLGAQAETVGQEQILQQATSRVGNFMEKKVIESTTNVIKNLSKMMWGDQFMEVTSSILVSASGAQPIYVDSSWKPGDREGEFWQYLFAITPGSMRLRSPNEKVQTTLSLVREFFLPLQQHIMAQGGTFDVAYLASFCAENMHLPELQNIITFAGGTPSGLPLPGMGTSSPVSQRSYKRVNVPGGGLDSSAANNWQSVDSQAARPQGAVA